MSLIGHVWVDQFDSFESCKRAVTKWVDWYNAERLNVRTNHWAT